MIKIIDNALSPSAYNDLMAQIACGPFLDEINPVDGVVYPLICQSIPKTVSDEVSDIVGGSEYVEFLRSSPKGVHCPHPVHNDASMGRISVMLYTSDIGGTAIVAHKRTGCAIQPKSETIIKTLQFDASDCDQWEVLEVAEAKPNRIAIFDARLMHIATPVGGFGNGVTARTVYTRFVK